MSGDPVTGRAYADIPLWIRLVAALPATLVALACLLAWSMFRIVGGVQASYESFLTDGRLWSAVLIGAMRVLVHVVFVAGPVAVAVFIIRPPRQITRQLWSTRATLLSTALVVWVPVAGFFTNVLG